MEVRGRSDACESLAGKAVTQDRVGIVQFTGPGVERIYNYIDPAPRGPYT